MAQVVDTQLSQSSCRFFDAFKGFVSAMYVVTIDLASKDIKINLLSVILLFIYHG